ncbi:PLxRFG domain-containing protein [Vibrio salinus]|uniref:PLxRFG domain-containing protein n=1 Tax=Vibrio salinus TaxID=2899784 RepID=UPI001E37022F|nr:PLxRFG domain-containing protein [Vibrio salinus]MCE0495785.1 PLxRFG domain-containing protein [Vibrio salinus]
MQDNELLGENPNATVNAKTNMNREADFSDASLDNWYKSRKPFFSQTTSVNTPQSTTSAKDYDVSLGDVAKSVGVGALGMVSGIGELSEQLTGYGEGLRDAAQSGSDYLVDSMTDDGKAAINADLINDEDGIKLGSGAGDIDVWAMKFAQGIGSLAGGFVLGGGAGSVTRMVASSMLKRGASTAIASQVAARTAQILESGVTAAPMIAGSHGGAMLDSRNDVMNMDAGVLSEKSEYFRNALREVSGDPNNSNLSATEKVNLAKEKTADYASKMTGLDPTTIAASVIGGAGDRLLFESLAGKAGQGVIRGTLRGAATEGLSEGIENAGQTYGQNVSINDVAGTKRDPLEGVAKNAIEGAAIGALTGAVPGGVGGVRGKFKSSAEDNAIDGEHKDISENTQQESAPENGANTFEEVPPVQIDNENLDIPAYERKDQIRTPIQGNFKEDPNNLDIPAYERQGKFIDSKESTPDESVQSAPGPFNSSDKEALKEDLTKAVDELKAALKEDRDDGRASVAKLDLSRYLTSIESDENLTPEQLEVVRKNSNEIYNKYWGIADNQESSQAELSIQQAPAKEPGSLQEKLDETINAKKETQPESKLVKNDMQSSLDHLIEERNKEYNQIRERVKSNLLDEDKGNEALIDRLAQTEFDYKYNNQKPDDAEPEKPQQYQDTFRAEDKEAANAVIDARSAKAKEAALQRQAEQERSGQPQPKVNPNVITKQDGQPVTRSFAKSKEEARNNEVERVKGIKRDAKQRELERAFGSNTVKTGLSKRLRRKIQRAKGFDNEKVLDEFRNNEKRLQAFHDEARRQADIEANKPENVKRRKSAQALFEEKISSPEAKQFAENLITESIKNVNTTLDQSAGTVLEMDGQESDLPKVKKQMANSIRTLANKFIGKTAALNDNLRAKALEKKTQEAASITEKVEQAAQETNAAPTEGQKEAGNYKKGAVNIQGMTVAIENSKGSTRSGRDPNGKSWSVKMKNHYGYVKGTNGADDDPVDVFIGPNPESDKVFVIDQVDPDTGKFDEHKAMLGFDDIDSAEKAYQSNYSKGWKGLGNINETTVEQFKDWLNSDKTSKPFENPKGKNQGSENVKESLDSIIIDKPETSFSLESVTSSRPEKGMTLKSAKLAADQWLNKYKGGAGVKLRVVKTQQEAESILGTKFGDQFVHALYNGDKGEVVVVADNIANPKQLRQKLRHEILVHHSLQSVIGDHEYNRIMDLVSKSKDSRFMKDIWSDVEKNYSDLSPHEKAEEVLAKAAESERGAVHKWLDRIVGVIAEALRQAGLLSESDITQSEMYNIVRTLGDRVRKTKPRPQGPDNNGQSVKFSQSKEDLDNYQSKLYKAMKSLKSRVDPVKVMDTPDVLKHVGMPDLPIYISRDIVRKATNGVKEDHDFDMSVIEDLPNLLSDPIAIFKPKNQAISKDGSKNILVEATTLAGKKAVVAIHANVQDHRMVVNRIASVHGRSNQNYNGWIREGLLEYIKSKNPDWLRLQGLQLPKERTFHQGSNKSLLTKDDIVKIQDSDKNTIKFSRTSQPKTIDEALEQITPKERFEGVTTAIGRAVKKAVQSKAGGAIKGDLGLGAVTLRQLSDLANHKLPQVKNYVDTVHKMLTQRNQLAFDAHEMANFVRKWAARNRKAADEMFDVAHLATVEGVDPDKEFKSAKETLEKRIQHLEKVNEGSHKTNEQMAELKELRNMLEGEPRRMRKHAELRARFYKMPKEAQHHYREMRDKYQQRHQLYKNLLEEQIQHAEIDNRIKKQRIAELKAQFELQEVMAPYFPLSRFGDYWISTTDRNGEKQFRMYESEKDQQIAKKKLESSGYQVLAGYKLEKNPAIEGASLSFVSDLMNKVEESSLNELKKGELKDTIYQMYLQSLPSRSMRKQFMHRQKVKGWSNDALRALAENMMKGSYQLARLQYSDELTKHVSDAIKVAGNSGDNQSSRYANELLKRHQWVMNPTHSKAAQKITSLGFLYMLGFSPAAAAINTTQNFVVALPMIGSKFGFGKASAELAKATKEFIAAKGSIKNKLKDIDELAAFSQWYDSGLLDSTNAHDLAGMAEGQNWSYNPAYEKFAGLMSGLFNAAEVYNRETTALAAYRLARKGGMKHEEATRYAEDLTWNAHFDYTNVNRARYMQAPFMKVATQFKQYSQNMTYYLMRNAYNSFKGMTKEDRVEASKQLIGTLGMTALIGGMSALPLSLVYSMANGFNALFGDDDEPFDAETEFKSYLSSVIGGGMADKIIYGAGGAGISPRISLDGMWIRDPNRDMEGEDTWSFYAQQAAGPVLGGTVLQAIKSLDKVADGEYYRAIEGVLPKVFKDTMKAYRYGDEGALNYRGDAYMESGDFDDMDLALQALGLTPSELSKQYQLNNARKEYEQHVLDRRSGLMSAYYLAWKQKDEDLMLDAQKAISKFNRKYPKLALDSKSIKRSIKTRQRYSKQSSNGINLNKNLRNFETAVVW